METNEIMPVTVDVMVPQLASSPSVMKATAHDFSLDLDAQDYFNFEDSGDATITDRIGTIVI